VAQRFLKIAVDVTRQVDLEHALQANQAAMQVTMGDLNAIVTTITAIAGQTKLLALNAGIEAGVPETRAAGSPSWRPRSRICPPIRGQRRNAPNRCWIGTMRKEKRRLHLPRVSRDDVGAQRMRHDQAHSVPQAVASA
jgi:hypothetical protein